jgi:hypothetical protein
MQIDAKTKAKIVLTNPDGTEATIQLAQPWSIDAKYPPDGGSIITVQGAVKSMVNP